MKSKLIYDENGLKTWVLLFDKEDEVKKSLLRFASENRLRGAQITAIGAFTEVTLGFFDRETNSYQEIPIKEQLEVLSFAGNITEKDTNPKLHAHVVVGKRASAKGRGNRFAIDRFVVLMARADTLKRAGILLLQLLVTTAGLWYVFHDPQKRAQIAIA